MSTTESFSECVRVFAARIAESGPVALSGLFDLTSQRLLRYAVTITRNQHDAEDVVQAVLVKVAAQPKLLANAKQPWLYLLRMVRNRALLVLRTRKRVSIVRGICDLLTRHSVDELEQEETYREVWTALRKIPADQSEIVVLKIWEEMTFAQIAKLLSVSPATAASRYRYAMEKLSRHLQPRRCEVPYE
jgi:RNA polymerase sigma-70 factor (ECF subfamily)